MFLATPGDLCFMPMMSQTMGSSQKAKDAPQKIRVVLQTYIQLATNGDAYGSQRGLSTTQRNSKGAQ